MEKKGWAVDIQLYDLIASGWPAEPEKKNEGFLTAVTMVRSYQQNEFSKLITWCFCEQ